MARYRQEREFLFNQKKSEQDIEMFLESFPQVDISKVKDEKENTALHQCAFWNRLNIMRKYLEYMQAFYKKKGEDQTVRVRQWLNDKNSEGFTAMHYAAYKGHTDILNYLLQQGASPRCTTNSGHSVLHLAAQGDKVETFIFFRQAYQINERDSKGGTPLHWASYNSSEKVVQYLLVQPKIELNIQDNQGQTPLHLAAAYGNTRIVRKLLLAGADRHILNNKSQTPKNIAQENQFWNIYKMLNDHYTCFDYIKFYCNVKVKYRPQDRSIFLPALFIFSYLFIVGTCFLQVQFLNWTNYILIGFYVVTLLLYLTLLRGPTPPKKESYKHFLDSKIALESICMTCRNGKPRRSYHCDICHVCIQQYDHHCPWINNCVGKRNLKRFIFFLLLLVMAFIGTAGISSYVIFSTANKEQPQNDIIKLRKIFNLEENVMVYIHYGLSSINLTVFLVFIIPILLLLSVQVKNLLLNLTTYQRFSNNKKSVLSASTISSRSHHYRSQYKPRNKASLKNCKSMCCGQSQITKSLLTQYSALNPTTESM